MTEKYIDKADENQTDEQVQNEETKEQQPSPKNQFPVLLLYLLIILMVLTGTTNSVFNKILQKLESKDVPFEQHHFVITFGMFMGELVSIFGYIYVVIQRRRQKKNVDEEVEEVVPDSEEEVKPPVKTNLIFAITAACDLCGTTLYTFALTYLTTSMYQMLRGFELVFVCIFSRVFLKNEIYRHQFLGVGSLILGLVLCGVSSIVNSKADAANARSPPIGIALMFVSMFFVATQYTLQEKFIKRHSVHPFQLVGFEGLWGCCMYAILLFIFHWIKCDSWNKTMKINICFCQKLIKENGKITDGENCRLEDTIFAFQQMGASAKVLGVFIAYVISIAMYNIVGINLTKLVSSTARAIIDTARTVFIWLFFMCFEPVKGVGEKFRPVQFVGFIFLILGSLIYNEIIKLKFWGLDYYLRENIAKRKQEEEESLQNGENNENYRLFSGNEKSPES